MYYRYFCSQTPFRLFEPHLKCLNTAGLKSTLNRLFFLSVQSVYFHHLCFFFKSTTTFLKGNQSANSVFFFLLITPLSSYSFWLPFPWSLFIHICIYIVRRNLAEWQWLFFLWIVRPKGGRTLVQDHYPAITSSSVCFSSSALVDVRWCCQESVS